MRVQSLRPGEEAAWRISLRYLADPDWPCLCDLKSRELVIGRLGSRA